MPAKEATESEICDWCVAYLRRMLDNPSIAVGPELTFAQMGLDSASAAYFIVELEEWLGTELDPELVYEYPTIARLARHIAARRGGGDDGVG